MLLKIETKRNPLLKELIFTNIFLGVVSIFFSDNFHFVVVFLLVGMIYLVSFDTSIILNNTFIEIDKGWLYKDFWGLNKIWGTRKLKVKDISSASIQVMGKYRMYPDDFFFTNNSGTLTITDIQDRKIALYSWMFSQEQFKNLLSKLKKLNPNIVFDEGAHWITSAPIEDLKKKRLDINMVYLYLVNVIFMVMYIWEIIQSFLSGTALNLFLL